jgi:predicted dehydrogenase
MGCIGTGGRGTSNLGTFISQKDVQIVAVCDLDKRSNLYYRGRVCGREPAKELVEKHYAESSPGEGYKGCKTFTDFRELLAVGDIDAVSIATPDHWHALVSIAAANAGKDIYCEKPLANSIAEGRAVCDAVKNNGRVLQTGTQERSADGSRFAAELVLNGRIGKLHTVRIQMPCGEPHHHAVMKVEGTPATQPVPEGFDYDFWLGPTAKAPYTPLRCHFWWRFILAHGGGEMTDRGAHIIDLAQMGMATDLTGPVEFEAKGTRRDGLYNVFMDYEFTNTYANGVRMIGMNFGPRGLKFEGTDGWVFVNVHGCALDAGPKSLLEEKIGADETQLGRSPGHHRNFLDCVKSRKEPLAKAEIGHRSASICHLNNIAMLTGRKLRWDPSSETIQEDTGANGMLSREMRAPWKLMG